MLKLQGSGVALVTPFDKKNNINYNKFEELIEFQIKNNTDFIVPCGTTGESSSLSNNEKKKIINFTVKTVKKRIPVVAGTGSNNTKIAIAMSKYAKIAGADAVLVVTPYYNKTNQEGLYIHYQKIAKAIYPLPLVIYNVPSRTGVNISVATILKLSKIENIIAIKEANPSLEKICNIILATKEENFSVLSGNDNLLLPILSVGGKGVISVAANILPDQMHNICQNNDKNLFYKYLDIMNNLFLDVNPIMIKEAMNYLGFDVGKVRLPLYTSKNEKLIKLYKSIDNIRGDFL